MENQTTTHPTWCQTIIKFFALFSILISALALMNTFSGFAPITQLKLLSYLEPTQAIAFINIGIAFFLASRQHASNINRAIITIIGILVFLLSCNMLFENIKPLTDAVNFILISIGIIIAANIEKPKYSLFLLGFIIFSIAMFSLFQDSYMVDKEYYLSALTRIPLMQTILFIWCGIALPLLRPHEYYVNILTSNTISGRYTRRALLCIVTIPFTVSFFENLGETYQLYHPDFGDSILSTLSTMLIMITIFIGAKNIHDEEELKNKTKNELDYITYNDPNMDILNLTGFQDILNKLIAEKKYKSIAIFKLLLNKMEFISHMIGDDEKNTLLFQLANRYKEAPTLGMTVIARIDKNQMGFIITTIHNDTDVSDIATKVLEILSEPFNVNGREIILTGNIGISVYPEDGRTVEPLMSAASAALKQAVKQDENSFSFCTPYLIYSQTERLEIENDLQIALAENQLQLFYHPQLNLKTGKFCGAETLLRWFHPKKGLIMPSLFISVAEESNMIVPIGEWIFHEACRQINAGWPFLPADSKRDNITLAVNVSAKQFNKKYPLASIFEEYLKEYAINPAAIEIEITESLLMQDTQENIKCLSALNNIGFKIAIDDFGTGFSSFSYLNQIPSDIIKIDKSFIDRITHSKNDMALVRAIIAMAHELGKKIIAEGVETADQVDLLNKMDCDIIQGHFYSAALSLEDFKDFIKSN